MKSSMSISRFISSRLSLRTGEKSHVAPAVAVATAGIALSVAVMLLAIAISTGFKNEIEGKIMGFDSQITVAPLSSYYADGAGNPLTLSAPLEQSAREVAREYGASVNVAASAGGIIKTENDFMGVVFKSHEGVSDSLFIASNLVEGEMPGNDSRGVVISEAIARKLNLKAGDRVDSYFITGETVRPRRFNVSGIYNSNFIDYDRSVVFAPYQAIIRILGHDPATETQTLQLSGMPTDRINSAAMALQKSLSMAHARGELQEPATVTTVFSTGAIYFNWLNLLDTNVVVILALMASVSGFMLVSCVLILILQRVRMIGILKAMGATDGQIRGIFLQLGGRVTLTGMIIGNAVALLLILVQWLWHPVPLDPDTYYLSYVPVELRLGQWIWLNAGVLLLSAALMLLPAMAVSRLSPLKTINFE